MQIRDLLRFLDRLAPRSYQESYDNSGLLVGSLAAEIAGVLVCLDSLETVIDEAISLGCNVVLAHHPIIFGGLKSLTGRNYVERTVLKAIKNDIAIVAIHTNLDNMQTGVNARICAKIGLQNCHILAPKRGIIKQLSTYAPVLEAEKVRAALFAAGAGVMGNYSKTSFNTLGTGTFMGNDASNGFVGEPNKLHREAEIKIEMIFEAHQENAVLKALHAAHPYEEVAYNVLSLGNLHKGIGAGMIGELATPLSEVDFMQLLKNQMNVSCVRHTTLLGKPIKKVAVCGGSGSFLLRNAIGSGADAFVTADFKYHEFFDAEQHLLIADIGHYESEQFTIDLLAESLEAEFSTLKVLKTSINTNSTHYF